MFSTKTGLKAGCFLAAARVAGETHLYCLQLFGNSFVNFNIVKPMHSLPLIIYHYALSLYQEWQEIAWSAGLVLVVLVMLLSTLSKRENMKDKDIILSVDPASIYRCQANKFYVTLRLKFVKRKLPQLLVLLEQGKHSLFVV